MIHTGQGKIEIRTADFLLHDGLGTKTNVATQNLHLTSTAGDSTIVVKNVDDEIPESFNPEIMYDRNLFDGQAVLIFSTKDKGSGLDHFEVKEGKFGRYESVVSPYLIKNQTLDRNIFIRAIDKNGNVRTEIIYPQIGQFSYKHVYVIMSILVLLCVPFVILFYRRFRF